MRRAFKPVSYDTNCNINASNHVETGYTTEILTQILALTVCVCVFFPFILDIKFVERTSPALGSHRRKVTQDFSSSTFFLRLLRNYNYLLLPKAEPEGSINS